MVGLRTLDVRRPNCPQVKFQILAGSAGTSLSDFLKKEIELEKEVSKKHTVRKIEGFEMKLENANVILSKSHDGEK